MACILYLKKNKQISGYFWKKKLDDQEPGFISLVFWKPENPDTYYREYFNPENVKAEIWNSNDIFYPPEFLLNLQASPPTQFHHAACLIDCDSQTLIFYSYLYEAPSLPTRRVYMALLQRTWPNWSVHWAERGFSEFIEWLGFSQSHYIQGFDSPDREARRIAWRDVLECFYPKEYFLQPNLDPENDTIMEHILFELEKETTTNPSCLISIKTKYGVKDYGFKVADGLLFSLGPKIIPKIYLSQDIVYTGEFIHLPKCGIFIDQERSRIYFWFENYIDPMLLKGMEEHWRGWVVCWHTKGIPYHFALSGRNPVEALFPFDVLQNSIRSNVDPLETPHRMYPTEKPAEFYSRTLTKILAELKKRYVSIWRYAGENPDFWD